MYRLPWGNYSMFNSRSQSGADFAWLANEISAIRSGVDTLTRDSATHKERITSVSQDVSRLENRITSNEANHDSRVKSIETTLRDIQLTNVKKDSSWTGPLKVVASLPAVAVLLAIMQYLVNLGLISLHK